MTRNEAAERLLRQIHGWVKVNSGALAHAEANLSDALATERRLTVERVRERLADNHNTLGAEYYRLDQIEDLLDDLLAPTADVDEEVGK